MRLTKVTIDHYRSIKHVEICMPERRPLVLFGANNAGKSSIISAIQRALGERWPLNLELEDSDFFMRDKELYPSAQISCQFDSVYFVDNYGNASDHFVLNYSVDTAKNQFTNYAGRKLYLNNDARSSIQSFVVDADRSIGRELSYYSRYSLLSKFSHAIHQALSEDDRSSLERSFGEIKKTFEGVPEYSTFFTKFKDVLEGSVKGFTHSLKADFSAYDPNNFARSIRVFAYEGNAVRAFEEFGTGEQQVLLMAFAKAYVETFGAQTLVLIIEEPEAHLHPLAQRWLKEYVYQTCSEGLQVILSTHSADFLDMSNLDGLVRVTKDEYGVTTARQLTVEDLVGFCRASGVPERLINETNVRPFFGSRLFPDEAKGLFANKVLIVEGATELFALPEAFRTLGHSLPQEGVEIVQARGKNSIPFFWRVYSAFGIECACIFDGDASDNKHRKANSDIGSIFSIDVNDAVSQLSDNDVFIGVNIAFFGKDYERFMRSKSDKYVSYENSLRENYGLSAKPEIARAAMHALKSDELPAEFETIWQRVVRMRPNTIALGNCESRSSSEGDDIPF